MAVPDRESPLQQWRFEQSVGDAGPFHDRPLPSPLRPTAWLHRVERPALVLGSTQSEELLRIDHARSLGIEVCRRRSGGGLVFIEPASSRWIDLLVPTDHERWETDVNRAFGWVGRLFAEAIQPLVTEQVAVHEGALEDREHGRVICFAGRGPGEVFVGDRKVVGISQRRTREGARFQALVVTKWQPDQLLELLQPNVMPHGLDLHDLHVGVSLDLDRVVENVLSALHRP